MSQADDTQRGGDGTLRGREDRSGKEHRQVQEDIERADAKALSAIINRDLIRCWIDLEYGSQKKYPRLRIGREGPRTAGR